AIEHVVVVFVAHAPEGSWDQSECRRIGDGGAGQEAQQGGIGSFRLIGQTGWGHRDPPVALVVAWNEKNAVAGPGLAGDLREGRHGVSRDAPVELTVLRVASGAVDETEVGLAG